MHDSTDTITQLHSAGVHLVLCRSQDEGNKKAKSAIESRWQSKSVALKPALAHVKAGGLLGFIPGRSGLWVLDIDNFPGENKAIDGLLANVSALAIVNTNRGVHAYFKKSASVPIPNRAWSTGGYSGDIRSDNGYAICWNLGALLEALGKLPAAAGVSTTLFPKPPKAKPTAKGFEKGNRTNALNAMVYAAELRGETDHSEVIEKALAAGLPAEKIAKATAKTIADADAQKGATFPRKDADALESALDALGITVRYNLRSMAPEIGQRRRKVGEVNRSHKRRSSPANCGSLQLPAGRQDGYGTFAVRAR